MASTPLPLLETSVALRRLAATEAPYLGWLHAETPQTVWVDPALIPEQAWRCDGDEHVLVPVDVARDGRGHAAIVPHCPERLGDAVRDAVHPGAAVTTAVSLLRAAAEAKRQGLTSGTWWVDATGRPVLAPTVEGSHWRDEATDVLARLAREASGALSDALVASGELLARERWSTAEADACEEALFRAADPVPLSQRSDRFDPGGREEPPPRRADTLRRHASAPPAAETWLAQMTGAAWAERVGEAARTVIAAPDALREWARRRRHAGEGSAPKGRRPRAPWLVAAAVALTIIVAGMLWPDAASDAGGDPATTPVASAAASPPQRQPSDDAPDAGPSTTAAPRADASGPGALESAATAILTALAACADVAGSCAGLMENPAASAPSGVVSTDTPRAVTLLDEYGGVAVFRVEASDQLPQILVLVAADGKWLVRDVYDVADQP